MHCPKCQFENPEDSNFCLECGQQFERNCPQCEKALPVDAKFCNGCGHKLILSPEAPPKDLSFDEKLIKIQKYLPKGLTEKILSQRDRIEGERKQVTVMFCDMEGFTSLSERLGPEEAYTVMDQVYEILIHKVHDYEGTVNEFTGDGIMALFGAPIALEDAPQRAIRSAYAIHREMTKFSDKIKQDKEKIPPIKMRIGIHTGPVVVGTLGNDLRVEFKAVGDTVNLASRIEGLAVPGSTYVSEDTYNLTEGLFRFEALGEYAVKGKTDTIKAYRVIAPSTSRTRFDVSAERGLTSFVGRQRELELLLDGFERSKAGRGQAFSIVAEAGVGKSRLLYEFRKAVANEDVTFHEGKCLSYSRDVTYHPIIDIVKSNFDIVEGDGDNQIRTKLKRGLDMLNTDEALTLPYLLELLSVKDSGVDAISLSSDGRKDRITEALNRSTIKASQIRPLIMAIEDLHWIDKSSEDSLKALLDSISGERIFLIFTHRPEYVHTWGAKSYHSQITLNRLSNRESLVMVSNILNTAEIHGDLEDFILEKTEGVPFFIEEFIRSLKDLKIIERKDNQYLFAKDFLEMTIPSTIQDVIMARVDALPEGAKGVVQTGSVIEREFSYELIKRVTGLSEQELLSRLSVLKDSELIFERGIYPETIYIFKHALTRDVVYDSILTRRREQLHEDIGNAIEEIYKESIDEYYGVLAEHYIYSKNYAKGADYSKLAERKAEKAASLSDAISFVKKRISCLEKLPVDDDVEKKIVSARTVLGLYYIQLAFPIEAKAAVDPIIDLAIKHNYKRRVSQINVILGFYYNHVDVDYPKALEYYEKAIKIGEELNDPLTLVLANNNMGQCLSDNGEFEKALSCLEMALGINVMANVQWGIVTVKANIIGWVYVCLGNVDLAYQTSQEALRIANESSDIFSKGFADFALGLSCLLKRCLKEAEEHLLKSADLFQKCNLLFYAAIANSYLSAIYLDMGEYETSKKTSERAISFLQHSSRAPVYIIWNKIFITLAKVMNNEKDINLNEIFKWHEDIKSKPAKGLVSNFIGKILLNIDDQHISEAEDWIKRSIETNQQYGMRWNLAQDYGLYGEFFKRKGDLPKAKENLTKSIEIFKECGADGWVGKYEKELTSLS
jgi:class 3 adenylate cyclase/tetratricopeptide (TPR) repeat protein/ABC-type lipoprotein export system ATPase subunit